MDKTEAKLARCINRDTPVDYPDFDAMWSRLEVQLPDPGTALIPVPPEAKKRGPLRKAAAIGALAALLAAAPVVAAVANRWDTILSYREGVRSALEQGLGQSIEQSVTRENVTFTVHTAIVDDNRTVLLYSLTASDKNADGKMMFDMEKVEMTDDRGQPIEGRKSLFWDPDSRTWRGYFETEWTPETPSANAKLLIRNLQALLPVELDIPFRPLEEKTQVFDIQQDGIGQVTVRPFVQNDSMMFASTIAFTQPEAKQWTFPQLGVYNGNTRVTEAGPGVFGTPDENGNYTAQQAFRVSDLQRDQVAYKLLYTKETRRINADWTFDLQLDKRKMESGTIRRDLNIPLEDGGQRMTLTQMIMTPTQIRIKASHEKYERFPYCIYALEVNGTRLYGGIADAHTNPEETVFRFEIPPGVKVSTNSQIAFLAEYQVLQHKDAKEPISLKRISGEKQTITTQVGGYPVIWTYYLKDGNLYVQSESKDPGFGGINQTYMRDGMKSIPANQVTANFSGDGNNQIIEMYPNFTGKEADLHIYWYYTDNPDKKLRVELAP